MSANHTLSGMFPNNFIKTYPKGCFLVVSYINGMCSQDFIR